MKFNLNEYKTVKERKLEFYQNWEDGRIVVKNITPDSQHLEYALFEARIYKTAEDQEKDLPLGTGYALEVRDKEISVSNSGKEYESVNYSSWTENCEESAVGRALDNAGYASDKKPSREEMSKAKRMNKTMKSYNNKATDKQRKFVTDLMRQNNVSIDDMRKKFSLKKGDKLTAKQASDAIEWLQNMESQTDKAVDDVAEALG